MPASIVRLGFGSPKRIITLGFSIGAALQRLPPRLFFFNAVFDKEVNINAVFDKEVNINAVFDKEFPVAVALETES